MKKDISRGIHLRQGYGGRAGRVILPLLVVVILLAAALGPCLGASAWYDRVVITKNLRLGTAPAGPECLLLGAGAKSGYEATWSAANKNAVDFRCASTATSGWAQTGAFYMKVQDYRLSGSAVRGYAYADAPSGASTGEISGVYGIGEQHGVGTLSATGKLMGLRSRVTVPTGLTIAAGNYYGL